MRRFFTCMLAVAVAGTVVMAEKAKTAEDIDKAMKKVGTTQQAVNKAIQAMAYGVPCVLSPVASEGIGLRPGQDCLVAETDDEWVEAVLRLYNDPHLWERISANGREIVQTQFSFGPGLQQMRKIFAAVGFH